jgi:succinyl-diaminopimelate desuccinylase
MPESLFKWLDDQRSTVLDWQSRLVSIPALGPENGGDGEAAKAEMVADLMADMGLDQVVEMNALDDRVPAGYRPNLAAVIPGRERERTLWVISHMDVVPAGELTLWDSDPFELRVEGDLIYGRGVEDNHQAMVSSLLAAKAVQEAGTTPGVNYGLLLVADEETGSRYGLEHVIANNAKLFRPDDLYLIPDFGGPDSTTIEVAEKSMLWVRVSVSGKQTHASTPSRGVNSLVAASALVLKIQDLYGEFPHTDEMFFPACSTFEPTKKEANVENVNTIPGQDVFYIDCRVLPNYDLDDVITRIREMGREVEESHGVTTEFEVMLKTQAAPGTDPQSPVVQRLSRSIRRVYGVEGRPVGIGGNTVAAVLRLRGYPAAVWGTLMHTAHQPNESSSVANTIGDAKVITHLLFPDA